MYITKKELEKIVKIGKKLSVIYATFTSNGVYLHNKDISIRINTIHADYEDFSLSMDTLSKIHKKIDDGMFLTISNNEINIKEKSFKLKTPLKIDDYLVSQFQFSNNAKSLILSTQDLQISNFKKIISKDYPNVYINDGKIFITNGKSIACKDIENPYIECIIYPEILDILSIYSNPCHIITEKINSYMYVSIKNPEIEINYTYYKDLLNPKIDKVLSNFEDVFSFNVPIITIKKVLKKITNPEIDIVGRFNNVYLVEEELEFVSKFNLANLDDFVNPLEYMSINSKYLNVLINSYKTKDNLHFQIKNRDTDDKACFITDGRFHSLIMGIKKSDVDVDKLNNLLLE